MSRDRTPSARDAFARHRPAVRQRLESGGGERPGPGSISRQINGEMIAVAAWGRAHLLQPAHPPTAAGVHQHTSFRGSLFSGFPRLHSTIAAMLAITFGDTERMIAAAAGINTIHDRVHGNVDLKPATYARAAAGTQAPSLEPATYSAHDP